MASSRLREGRELAEVAQGERTGAVQSVIAGCLRTPDELQVLSDAVRDVIHAIYADASDAELRKSGARLLGYAHQLQTVVALLAEAAGELRGLVLASEISASKGDTTR